MLFLVEDISITSLCAVTLSNFLLIYKCLNLK